MNTRTLVAITVVMSMVVLAAPSRALAQTTQTEPDVGTAPVDRYSDEDLDAYVRVSLQIRDMEKDYAERMEKADDVGREQQIRFELRQAKIEAIRDSGLTVRRYNDISRLARSDPNLQSKIDRREREAAE